MLNTKWSVVKDLAQKINKEQNQTSLKNRSDSMTDLFFASLIHDFALIYDICQLYSLLYWPLSNKTFYLIYVEMSLVITVINN